MPRNRDEARRRLQQATLSCSANAVTMRQRYGEIAACAGVTERTFFAISQTSAKLCLRWEVLRDRLVEGVLAALKRWL